MIKTLEHRDARIPLCRGWGRKSSAGRTYFTGRLGQARLLLFPDTDPEGTPVLDLVLVPAEPRERAEAAGVDRQGANGGGSDALRESAHPRSAWHRPPASDCNPFD